MNISKLTPLEERAYLTLVDTKKKIVSLEAEAIKAERIQAEAPILAARQNIPIEQAVEVLTSRSTGNLLVHDEIRFQSLGCVPVSAVLADSAKYDNQSCADPLEPEEGTSKAKFYANPEGGTPLIHSMLHGGAIYYLTHNTDNLLIKYPGNAVPAGMTKNEVLLKITELLSRNELSSQRWCEVLSSANLSQTEMDSVLDLLAATMQTKKTLLKKEYADYLDQAEATASFDQLKAAANGKVLIEYTEHNLNEATALAEQAIMEVPGEWPYFNYGNVLSYSTYDYLVNKSVGEGDEKPPKIPVIKPYTKDNLYLRIEQSALHYKVKKVNGTETRVPIATPQAIVNKLFEHPAPLAPRVAGLVSHPILALDGKVIDTEGVDDHTGLLVRFGGSFFVPLPSQVTREEASEAADRIFRNMFSDICFRNSPVQEGLYGKTALALLLTGVFRKVIDLAPGFLIVANVQGSGKTTLARMVHIILTGKDMPASSLGSSAEEMKKELLAMFIQSPAMVCYDNVLDGSEVNDPILAKALTSSEFKGRILGRTQEATVPTNTVIAMTGNNVTLGADLVRRFVTVLLTADRAQPERKTYRYPDIVQHCLNIRRGVIRDCLVITKAYIDAGCPIDPAEVGSSGFVQWDKMVRLPLLWATGIDVMNSMDENREQSTEHLSATRVLNCLHDLFGEESFTASNVMAACQKELGSPDEIVDSLREGLANISSKSLFSIKSLGWVLKKLEGRPNDDIILHKEMTSRSRAEKFRIKKI